MSFSSKVDVLELLTTVLKEQVEKLEEMVDQIEKDMDEQRYINRCIKYAMLQELRRKPRAIIHCPECEQISPNPNATYCIYCGAKLGYKDSTGYTTSPGASRRLT